MLIQDHQVVGVEGHEAGGVLHQAEVERAAEGHCLEAAGNFHEAAGNFHEAGGSFHACLAEGILQEEEVAYP
jgi:hypothetical protein